MNGYYRKLNILKNYTSLLKEIDDLTCDCAELLAQATKVNQTLHDDVGPANHDNQSKIEGITIKMAEKRNKLEAAIKQRNKIDNALESLPFKQQELIKESDMNNRSVYYASKKMNMNYQYACRLHSKVVKNMKI